MVNDLEYLDLKMDQVAFQFIHEEDHKLLQEAFANVQKDSSTMYSMISYNSHSNMYILKLIYILQLLQLKHSGTQVLDVDNSSADEVN